MSVIEINQALAMLKNNQVVALPTETVYGLGADIDSNQALELIFSIKKRPFFDPLIVHIENVSKAKDLCKDFSNTHEILAHHFWPGPLTMILPKDDSINSLITSGSDKVGLRCPKNADFLEILTHFRGIAAPSANLFGRTSPTSYQDVESEFSGQVSVLKSNPCEIGIESSVIEIFEQNKTIKIYRPGHVTKIDLEKVLKQNNLLYNIEYAESPVSPGQIKHHYQPSKQLNTFDLKDFESLSPEIIKNSFVWHLPLDPIISARMLYQKMREGDLSPHQSSIFVISQINQKDLWLGILNRLEKASQYISASLKH